MQRRRSKGLRGVGAVVDAEGGSDTAIVTSSPVVTRTAERGTITESINTTTSEIIDPCDVRTELLVYAIDEQLCRGLYSEYFPKILQSLREIAVQGRIVIVGYSTDQFYNHIVRDYVYVDYIRLDDDNPYPIFKFKEYLNFPAVIVLLARQSSAICRRLNTDILLSVPRNVMPEHAITMLRSNLIQLNDQYLANIFDDIPKHNEPYDPSSSYRPNQYRSDRSRSVKYRRRLVRYSDGGRIEEDCDDDDNDVVDDDNDDDDDDDGDVVNAGDNDEENDPEGGLCLKTDGCRDAINVVSTIDRAQQKSDYYVDSQTRKKINDIDQELETLLKLPTT